MHDRRGRIAVPALLEELRAVEDVQVQNIIWWQQLKNGTGCMQDIQGFNNIFHKRLPMVESAAVTTKGAVPRGVWGHVPPEKFEIQKLGNAISSILCIKKSAVDDYVY